MSNNLIAFVSGFGTGYMNENNRRRKEEKDDEDRSLRNEASRLQIDAAKKQVSDQAALADSAKPIAMTEGAGGMLKPDTMDNRDVGLPESAALPNQGLQVGGYNVAGKQFADPVAANAELTTQNSPEATQKRVITAMRGIDPLKAMDAEHTMTQRGRETIKFTQEQEAYAKKLKDEGAIDALKSLRTGDGAGMVSAFNKGGEYKIEGEPVITSVERDIPGIGKVPTFSAAFNVKGKDGALKPMTVNSHDLGMSLMPYEKWYDAQLKGKDAQGKGELRAAQAENMALRAGIAASRAGGSGAGRGGAAEEATQFNPLGDFDSKKAQAVAFDQASKLAAESAATGKPMTAAEQGRLAQQTYRSMEDAFASENTRRFTQQTVANELRTVASDPAAYANAYGNALKLGMNANNLKELGFAPPPSKAAPIAAKAPAPVTPATTPVAPKPAPAGGYVAPTHYVGIEKVAPRRGSPGGYSYQGKQYATEQEALAAYENSKAQIIATKQGLR